MDDDDDKTPVQLTPRMRRHRRQSSLLLDRVQLVIEEMRLLPGVTLPPDGPQTIELRTLLKRYFGAFFDQGVRSRDAELVGLEADLQRAHANRQRAEARCRALQMSILRCSRGELTLRQLIDEALR